jgi:hypothetical protein
MPRGGKRAGAGRPVLGKEQVHLYMSKQGLERLNAIAQAENISKGEVADRLFVMLPVFGKAKLAIELLLSGDPKAKKYAEAVLLDMEDLEIEHLYEEAITEGIIQPKGGAWIV